jgi:hypothetical protein
MYSSLRISRFRSFLEFRIEGFQRFNLITGQNNVGKTALLEALFIHCGGANIRLPFAVEGFRGVSQLQAPMDAAVAGLFYDFDPASVIELQATELGITRTCALRIVEAPTTIPRDRSDEVPASPTKALELTWDDPAKGGSTTKRAVFDKEGLRMDPLGMPPFREAVFVNTSSRDHKTDALRFSRLAKIVGEEDRFAEALAAIEPSIKKVRLLDHAGVTMIHADVGLKRFLPLAYAGGGLVRMGSLLTAIAVSGHGAILIDEFENGLHHTVLAKAWQAVLAFAERFDVQVFATTHSAECIQAAHQAFSQHDYAFRLFRLARVSDGTIAALPFERDALEAALRTDLDLR